MQKFKYKIITPCNDGTKMYNKQQFVGKKTNQHKDQRQFIKMIPLFNILLDKNVDHPYVFFFYFCNKTVKTIQNKYRNKNFNYSTILIILIIKVNKITSFYNISIQFIFVSQELLIQQQKAQQFQHKYNRIVNTFHKTNFIRISNPYKTQIQIIYIIRIIQISYKFYQGHIYKIQRYIKYRIILQIIIIGSLNIYIIILILTQIKTNNNNYHHIILIYNIQEYNNKMLLQNIQQINQDLQIRNYYLQSNTDKLSSSNINLFNSQRLIQALKKRNQAYSQHFNHQRLQPISDPIRHLSQRAVKFAKFNTMQQEIQISKQQLNKQWNSQLYYQKFTYTNQENYIDQHQEYLIHSMVSQSFDNNSNINKSIKTTLMNKLKGYKDNQQYMPSKNTMLKIQKQEQMNKEKYCNFIKRKILANQDRITSMDQFQWMGGDIGKFWKVIAEQIKSYEYAVKHQKNNPELAIVNASITLIQGEFRQQISSTDNQRKRYLLNTNPRDVQINSQGVLTWGVPYALYRAGIWNKFTIALNDKGRQGIILRQLFTKLHNSIAALEPTNQVFDKQRNNDIFYNSLASIVQGNAIINDTLFKIGEIDFIWMVLKTIKIYTKNNQIKRNQFQQAMQALLQYFVMHEEKYKNNGLFPFLQFVYLGDYQNLINYYNKSRIFRHGFTQDDFIHLLLVLQSKPELIDQNLHNNLTQHLQKHFKSYLGALIRDPQFKQYTIFYLLQMPQSIFSDVIQHVFNSWKLFDQINQISIDNLKGWRYIKFRYQFNQLGDIFQLGISKLLRSLRDIEKDSQIHLKLVNAAQELFNNQQNYLDFVLLCQCKYLLELKNTVNKSITQKKQTQNKQFYTKLNKILKQMIKDNSQLQKQYGTIIQFIEKYCELQNIMKEKQIAKLQNLLKHQEYIGDLPLLISSDNNYMRDLFDKLEVYGSLELFFIYLENIVFSKEKVLYMKGIHDKLRDYKDGILKNLNKIMAKKEYDIKRYSRHFNF